MIDFKFKFKKKRSIILFKSITPPQTFQSFKYKNGKISPDTFQKYQYKNGKITHFYFVILKTYIIPSNLKFLFHNF